MTDFHSHVLPKMDDGSKSTEESLEMLKALSEQGVNKVIATPHYYANDESVEDFLKRREASFERLKLLLTSEMPEILLGAEIRFYEGISRLSDLKALCIQNTNLLLLEMQMDKWTEYTLRELIEISNNRGITLVLAHVERYMKFQQKGVVERLLANGVLMQINADFVCNIFTRSKAIKMLKKQKVHLLGSDCHNMSDRPPKIGEALRIIGKKLGEGYDDYANNFLKY